MKFCTINSKWFLFLYISNNRQQCKRFRTFLTQEQYIAHINFSRKYSKISPSSQQTG